MHSVPITRCLSDTTHSTRIPTTDPYMNGNNTHNTNNGTREWFGKLAAIITGKTMDDSSTNKYDTNVLDGRKDESPRPQRHHFHQQQGYQNQDVTQTYRDQAEAFLKKTELERTRMKELSNARQQL